MTLQSQSIRSSSVPRSSETLVRLRRRGQRRLFGVMLFVLVVGGVFVYLIYYRDGGAAIGPQSAKADAPAPAKAATPIGPAVDPLATARPPQHAAPEMVMTNKPRPAHAGAPATSPSGTLIPAGPIPSESPLAGSTTPAPSASPTRPTNTPASTPTSTPSGNTLLPLPAGTPAGNAAEASGLPADLAQAMAAADRANADRKPVEARTQLNKVLLDPRTPSNDRAGIRQYMAQLNQDVVFSPTVFASDAIAAKYTVVSGDNLVKIARKEATVTEPSLIARVNKLSNPNALQIGQSLKVVKGPFHAVVSKSGYRMDIYSGAAPSPSSLGAANLPEGAEPGWTYICSFPVGLGEKGATPIANFSVKDNKLVNPTWANPRTGEKFAAEDPKNPIGERWIGLAGLDERSKGFAGYGIHGTIQPESIGTEMSMGCVRMRHEDVEIVYDLLMPKVSIVKIVP